MLRAAIYLLVGWTIKMYFTRLVGVGKVGAGHAGKNTVEFTMSLQDINPRLLEIPIRTAAKMKMDLFKITIAQVGILLTAINDGKKYIFFR
jgi:hypothetical protein